MSGHSKNKAGENVSNIFVSFNPHGCGKLPALQKSLDRAMRNEERIVLLDSKTELIAMQGSVSAESYPDE